MSRTIDGVSVDRTVNALNVIDTVHHEVHEDEHFEAVDYQTGKTAFDWLVTTPADKYVHIMWQCVTSGAATLTVYREATATASATLVSPINSDHSSANTSSTVICSTPTSITPGSDIIGRALMGSNVKAGGGITGRSGTNP